MNIAIIGTGNVGGALAEKWSAAGHNINLGVRDKEQFKGKELLNNPNTAVYSIQEAVSKSEVVIVAVPALMAIPICQLMGNTQDKIIIDTMNIVRQNGPEGYKTTTQALLDHTDSKDIVKCFNTTGFNNIHNPNYGNTKLDLFVAGDSTKGVIVAQQLAQDAGFDQCYHIGGNDKFEQMEEFARFWINLALFQGFGREIGFKLLRRS